MSNAMHEAARRTGDNLYILHDIEAYKAAKKFGVPEEQLDKMEAETLELAARLARHCQVGPDAALPAVHVEYLSTQEH